MTITNHRPSIRTAGSLSRAGALSEYRSPVSRAAAVLVPLTLLGALALLAWVVTRDDDPQLADLALVGARGPQCVRVVIASDVSGSMQDAASARDSAIGTLLTWLPGNLRPDDEVAALAFAAVVGPVTGPATLDALARSPFTVPGTVADGTDTVWRPVLTAVRALPASPCSTSLLVVSDAQLNPLPTDAGAAREQLTAAGVDDLHLLVPSDDLDVPDGWNDLYPYAPPVRFDGTDRDETARALAQTVADITGQQLRHR